MAIKKVKNSVTKWRDFNDYESNKQEKQFDLDSFLGIDTSKAVQSAYNDRISSEQGKLWSTRNTQDGESERLGMLKSNSDFAKKQVEKNFAKINTPFPLTEDSKSISKVDRATYGNNTMGYLKDREKEKQSIVSDYVSKYGYLTKGSTKEEEKAYYDRFSKEYGIREKNNTDDVFDKSRILSTISNAIAPMNADEMDMLIQQNSQNKGSKVGNVLTGLAGNMVGLAMNPGGGLANGKNLLNVTDDLAEGVASKVAPKLGNNLAGKLGTQAVRGAVDGGIGGALDTVRGNDTQNLASNVATGALGGVMLFGGGKALKEGSNAINSKLTSSALDSVDGMFNIKAVDGDSVNRSFKGNNPGMNNLSAKIDTKVEQPKANNAELPKVDFDNRDFNNINEMKNYKGALSDNPELAYHIKQYAEMELGNIRSGSKGGKTVIGSNGERISQPRIMSEGIEIIKAQTGASYDKIEASLNKIANGQVNDTLTRKIELILDDSLTNGTRSSLGDIIPPNKDYVESKNLYEQMSNGDYSGIYGNSNMSVKDNPLNDVVKSNNEIAATNLADVKKSKHATETMQNSPNITDDVKNQLNKYDFEYETVTNQGDYNNAVEFVKKANAKDEYMRSSGTSSQDTANGIALIQKLQADGDIESLIDVTSKLTTDLSKAGQTIQAARILNGLTPEGKLVYAQRQINKAADDIIKTKDLNLDNESKAITDKLNEINNGASDTITNEISDNIDNIITAGKKNKSKPTPEERLSSKVDTHTKEGSTREIERETMLVNTLYDIAKKTLPEKSKSIPKDPIEFVSEAIQNRDKYQDVWNKAKQILKDKYYNGNNEGDDEAYALLEDWFNQKARPIFMENKANKAISQTLKEKGIDIKKLVKGHYGSGTTKDLAETLVNKAGLSGDDAKVLSNYVQKRMHELTKDTKEKLLADMLKDKKKSIPKTELERIIELSNMGAFENSSVRDLLIKKYELPQLTADDSKFILSKMKEYQNSASDREKEILLGQVQKLIGNKIPSKMMDKIDSFRYLNMLFNPKTLIKNAGGNLVNTVIGTGRDLIGSGIDKAIGTKTGLRTTTGFNIGAWGEGAKKGLSNTLEDSKLGIDTSFGANKEGARGNALRDIPILGKAEELLGTGLQLGDRPFYEGAKSNFIANYMKLNGIDDISKVPANVLEEAHNVGLEATYQQKTGLGNLISFAKSGDYFGVKAPMVGNVVKTLLPFAQTPSAILDTAINYTPVGAIKGGLKINKLLKNVDVDNALNLQRKGVNELASGIVGTGLIGAGIGLGNSGLMTGDLSGDNETAALQRQTGMQPYALKVGDTYNDLSFAQPGASPLMMGADIAQNGINKDTLGVGLNSIMNNSYFSGIKDLFGTVNNKGWKGALDSLAGNYVNQLAPFGSLASNINKTIDPTVRDTYSNDLLDKNVNKIMSKYPGLSQMLPQATDTIGDGKEYNEGFGTFGGAVNNFINPLNTTKFTPTEVEQNALDMYNKDGSTVQIPRYAPKSISYGKGKQYTPTAEENRLFNSMIANALKNAKETPEDYQKAMTKAAAEWREKVKSKNNLK